MFPGISYKSKNARAPSAIPHSPSKTGGDPTVDDNDGQLITRSDKKLETNLNSMKNDEASQEINVSSKASSKPDSNVETRLPNKAENKLISSLIKSSGSLEKSMERSWLLTENLNDDLCEGFDTSGSPNEDDFIERGVNQKENGTTVENFESKEIRTVESRAVWREIDEMKASLTNTWSEDSSTSYPTVSLSPPSCLKPKQTFVYGDKCDVSPGKPSSGETEIGIKGSDSVTFSPARKSVALVNPFPETAKHLNRSVPETKSTDCKQTDLIDELIKTNYR